MLRYLKIFTFLNPCVQVLASPPSRSSDRSISTSKTLRFCFHNMQPAHYEAHQWSGKVFGAPLAPSLILLSFFLLHRPYLPVTFRRNDQFHSHGFDRAGMNPSHQSFLKFRPLNEVCDTVS